MTVDSNSAVGGTLLVDEIDTSLVTEISILDNVVVGWTTGNNNLTANGTATAGGTLRSVGDLTVEATRSNFLSNITSKHKHGWSQLYFRNIGVTLQEQTADISNDRLMV